jgi:hypothetical protein
LDEREEEREEKWALLQELALAHASKGVFGLRIRWNGMEWSGS